MAQGDFEPVYKPGDVVRLKSGGPAMTVVICKKSDYGDGQYAMTYWFSLEDHIQKASFDVVLLKPGEETS